MHFHAHGWMVSKAACFLYLCSLLFGASFWRACVKGYRADGFQKALFRFLFLF